MAIATRKVQSVLFQRDKILEKRLFGLNSLKALTIVKTQLEGTVRTSIERHIKATSSRSIALSK